MKIYEYTPAWMHAKTFIADDRSAVVGTINLDYRSLYLHFECGVWMCDTPAIADMKAEYLSELERSAPITEELCLQQRRGRRLSAPCCARSRRCFKRIPSDLSGFPLESRISSCKNRSCKVYPRFDILACPKIETGKE